MKPCIMPGPMRDRALGQQSCPRRCGPGGRTDQSKPPLPVLVGVVRTSAVAGSHTASYKTGERACSVTERGMRRDVRYALAVDPDVAAVAEGLSDCFFPPWIGRREFRAGDALSSGTGPLLPCGGHAEFLLLPSSSEPPIEARTPRRLPALDGVANPESSFLRS